MTRIFSFVLQFTPSQFPSFKVSYFLQKEVYEKTTKDLIESVIDGYNATVFAYGPTGVSSFAVLSSCA